MRLSNKVVMFHICLFVFEKFNNVSFSFLWWNSSLVSKSQNFTTIYFDVAIPFFQNYSSKNYEKASKSFLPWTFINKYSYDADNRKFCIANKGKFVMAQNYF